MVVVRSDEMSLSAASNISPEDKIRVLTLSRIRGIGPRVFKKLLGVCESIEKIFEAPFEQLVQKVGPKVARDIKAQECLGSLDKYLKELEKNEISFTTVLNNDYPLLLKEIHDPPIVLYYRGNFKVEDFSKCFAVVGTRNSTRYGEEVTKKLVAGLVDAGFAIVSGMAFGIDKCAHEVTIESRGRTIAVLSGRVDEPSPYSNSKIYEKILENGCVISATHLETELKAGMFPPRNRIISGLSLGTLIIEAGEKSGALITAKLALEQDREVFAVPGDIYSNKSVGTNNLIKKGEAKLVSEVGDILEEFGFKVREEDVRKQLEFNPTEQKILDVLFRGPLCLDEVSQLTDIEISQVSKIVAMMELDRKLAKVEGNRYVILK